MTNCRVTISTERKKESNGDIESEKTTSTTKRNSLKREAEPAEYNTKNALNQQKWDSTILYFVEIGKVISTRINSVDQR